MSLPPTMVLVVTDACVTGKLGFGGNATHDREHRVLGQRPRARLRQHARGPPGEPPEQGPPPRLRGPRHLGAPRRRAARAGAPARRRPRRGRASCAPRSPTCSPPLATGEPPPRRRRSTIATRRARRRAIRERDDPRHGEPGCGAGRHPDRPLWPIAVAAVDLLRSDRLARREAVRRVLLAVPRPQPQRLAALVLDGRVRRPREDAPLPRARRGVKRLAAAEHRHELLDPARARLGLLRVLEPVQDRVAVVASRALEELARRGVAVERGAQVVGTVAVLGAS